MFEHKECCDPRTREDSPYSFSTTPSPTLFSTVNPASLAFLLEKESFLVVETREMSFFRGFLQIGQERSAERLMGRLSSNGRRQT